MRGACVSARCSREERIRVSTVRASLAGRANAYSRIMHSATVRGVHRPSVSNELNCTGKRAGVREWKGRPCLCRESHEPGPQPRASTLHRGGPHVLRVHAHARARARESSRASRARPLNYREAGFVRGVAVLAPDYDLLRLFYFFLTRFTSSLSLVRFFRYEKCRWKEGSIGKEEGTGSIFTSWV